MKFRFIEELPIFMTFHVYESLQLFCYCILISCNRIVFHSESETEKMNIIGGCRPVNSLTKCAAVNREKKSE